MDKKRGGLDSRKPDWAGSMMYGAPQEQVLKQWPRSNASCHCEYARPGYNNSVRDMAEKKMHSKELGDKAMYV